MILICHSLLKKKERLGDQSRLAKFPQCVELEGERLHGSTIVKVCFYTTLGCFL